jgi:MFS family permease
MALAANAVGAHEQGATAGTVAAAHGLGMILGPLVGTLVYDLHPGAPYLLVAVLLVLVALWPARAPVSALEVRRVG